MAITSEQYKALQEKYKAKPNPIKDSRPITVIPRKTQTAKPTTTLNKPAGNTLKNVVSGIGNLVNKVADVKKNVMGGVVNTINNMATNNKQQTPTVNYGQEAVNNISGYLKDMQNTYNQNTEDTKVMFESKRESDLAALRNAIAKQRSNYQQQLEQSRQQFQPARDAVDVNRARSLQSVRELQGAQGVFGGDNITTQTSINTSADASIGGLNQSQANYESGIQRSMADLENAQTEQERQIITQNLADQIQATINSRNNLMSNQTSANSQLLNALQIAQSGQQFREQLGQSGQQFQQQMDLNRTNADRSFGLNEAGLTGTYQGNRTLQGRQADVQLEGQYLDNISRSLGITKDQYLLSVLPKQIENQFTREEQAILASDIANQLNQYNLDFLQPLELQRLQSAIASQDASTAYQVIQNSFAPQMLKEQIASSVASRNLSQSNANRSQANADREFFAKYEADGQGGFRERQADKATNKDAEYNSNFGLAFNKFKQYPVADAKKLLSQPNIVEEIIATLGIKGYEELYNAVLRDAITKGQAMPFNYIPE